MATPQRGTLASLKFYVVEDARAHGIARMSILELLRRPTLQFQVALRLSEEALAHRSVVVQRLGVVLRLFARRKGRKLGFSIPPGVFGPGLWLQHWGTIVVNDKARVGARCRLHPSTSIGVWNWEAPTIGDDVYIGPGAKIFGGIHIGDRTNIGANAVVNRSFPNSDQTLVGVPAQPTQPEFRSAQTSVP